MAEQKPNSKSLNLARAYLGKEVAVEIDRPLGSKHPQYDMVYEVNYGFVPGVMAPDGEALDAYYLGSEPVAAASGAVIAVVHRLDDDDDKLVVAPAGKDFTEEEIKKLVHFQEKYFDYEIVKS